MKELKEYVLEHINESEESIKSESDFRKWAEAKFKEVYGNDYDADKMKSTVDGFLKDNKSKVDDGAWGELVGMMNKSFTE